MHIRTCARVCCCVFVAFVVCEYVCLSVYEHAFVKNRQTAVFVSFTEHYRSQF